VEAETVCRRGAGGNSAGGDVPALAREAADRGVVPKHGRAGTDRAVLRHGHLQTHSVLRDGVYSAARVVAVSESVRGRGVL